MLGMLYSIDVLFLDANWRIVAIKEKLRPFALAWGGKHAKITIEFPKGTLQSVQVKVGDQIEIEQH